MAQISVSVSTENDSRIWVRWSASNPELLAIDCHVNIGNPVDPANPIPYERSDVHFHGTVADLRELSKQIAAALAPASGPLNQAANYQVPPERKPL